MSREGKELLFRQIVVPQIRYCSTVLSMANKTDIQRLQKNFNKGMWAVLNKQRSENVNRMLNQMGFVSIDKEMERDVLSIIFRIQYCYLLFSS